MKKNKQMFKKILFLVIGIFLYSCNQINKENKFYSFLVDKDNDCTYWYSSEDQSIMEFCKSGRYGDYYSDADFSKFKEYPKNDLLYCYPNDTWSLKDDTIFFNESQEFYTVIIDINEKELIIKPSNERYGERMIFKKIENESIFIDKTLIPLKNFPKQVSD
jgi:hypothetical protein